MTVSSVSDMEGKRIMRAGIEEWMDKHINELRRWLDTNVSLTDRKPFKKRVMENESLLYATYLIIRQSSLANEDKLSDMIKNLNERTGLLWLIIGKKRSGKTSLLHLIGENLKKTYKKQVWWYGPPAILPSYIDGHTLDMNKIPAGSLVLVDESSILFFSRLRDEMTTEFIRRLPVIAHADKNYIFCTQSSAITDLNIIRLADALIFKNYSVLQSETERFKVSDQLALFMPTHINEALYFDNDSLKMFEYPLPKWWDEKYSKPYAPFKSDADYYRFTLQLLDDIPDIRKVIDMIGMRGKEVGMMEVEMIRLMTEYYTFEFLMSQSDEILESMVNEGFDDTPLYYQAQGQFYKIKGDFKLPPLDQEEDDRRQREDPIYSIMSKRNINPIFLTQIVFRFDHIANIILSIFGDTGSGKSYATLSLCELFALLMESEFPVENVENDINTIIDRLKTIKSKNTLAMDEQVEEFGCLDGKTKIIAKEGIRNIKDLKSKVLTLNFNNNKTEFKYAKLINSEKKELFRLNTTFGNVNATLDHKFYTELGWLSLSKLLYICSSIIKDDQKESNMHKLWKRISNRDKSLQLQSETWKKEVLLLKKMCGQRTLKTNVRKQHIKKTGCSRKNLRINEGVAQIRKKQRCPKKIGCNNKKESRKGIRKKGLPYLQKNFQIPEKMEKTDMQSPMLKYNGMEKRKMEEQPQEIKQINKRTLQKTSGEASKLHTRQPEEFYEKINRNPNIQNTSKARTKNESGLLFQPLYTNKKAFKMGRLCNTVNKIRHRMRRNKISQPTKRYNTKCRIERSRMENFKVKGKGNRTKPRILQIKDIINIKRIGIQNTYDLKVKSNHNFILANGMIVHNSGSGRAKAEMRNVEETFRKRQVNFIYNSPTIRTHTHQFVLKTHGIDYKQKLVKLLVYKSYPGIPHGYITLGLPNKKLIEAYEKKKDSFLERIEKRTTGLQEYKEKLAKSMSEDSRYEMLKTQRSRLTYIRKLYPNLSTTEAEEVRSLIEIIALQ